MSLFHHRLLNPRFGISATTDGVTTAIMFRTQPYRCNIGLEFGDMTAPGGGEYIVHRETPSTILQNKELIRLAQLVFGVYALPGERVGVDKFLY